MNVGELENYYKSFKPTINTSHYNIDKRDKSESVFGDTKSDFYNKKLYKYIYGRVGLMCPKCYNYFKINLNYNMNLSCEIDDLSIFPYSLEFKPIINIVSLMCDFCKCTDVELIRIDHNIVEDISILNKKGFITKYSCDGHIHGRAYISFDGNKILDYINTLPITWTLRNNYARKNVTCPKNIIRIEAEPNCHEEALLDLHEWVKSLPDINN